MPLLLHVDKLTPRMCLAGNVMNGFSLFLPVGWELADCDIEALRSESPHAHVPVKIPGLDRNVEFEDTTLEENISLEVRKEIGELFNELVNMVLANAELDAEYILSARRIIAKALTRVQYNSVKTAILTPHTTDADYLANHTANVFHLSAVIASKIVRYIKEERERSSSVKNLENAASLAPLATGAFFHDIDLISTNTLPCTTSTHPTKGADMLAGRVSSMARVIVGSHHENWDGSGRPKGIVGNSINVHARILRVADAYCTATAAQPGAKGKGAPAALHEMLHGKDQQFYDPTILEALAGVIAPFPNGSLLKLQTGESAVVVGHNPGDTFRPKVVIAFDRHNKLMATKHLENAFFLTDRKDLKVIACGNEDVTSFGTAEANKGNPTSAGKAAEQTANAG